jgi:hypothetical protein
MGNPKFYYLLFIIYFFLSIFSYWVVRSNILISYPEEEKVSLREGSTHSRNSSFFYNPIRRFPTGDDGFGFGK